MIDAIYRQIRTLVDPSTRTAAQARMYIAELAVFAQHNAQFLRLATEQVYGSCPALGHEFDRNFFKEGGEPARSPPTTSSTPARCSPISACSSTAASPPTRPPSLSSNTRSS
ncbi:hypothetical protein OG239_00380 [Streptomyces sp. NBC_00868]|uniref:hypothetical protein n=1 Tax=unclassified Streptomyces TaxID=2593676 RepID=UPI003246F0BF|nr:hypothetical protein OG239_00380 [Streptomyces sp. NBC_00868]